MTEEPQLGTTWIQVEVGFVGFFLGLVLDWITFPFSDHRQ